jgi:MoxR-like ATPase
VEVLSRFQTDNPLLSLEPVCAPQEILEIRKLVRQIQVKEEIKNFIIRISSETRRSVHVKLGLSPRASQHLMLAAQTNALIEGRDFVIPEDVLSVSQAVLAHRILLSAEARMENKTANQIIDSIRGEIPVPTGL